MYPALDAANPAGLSSAVVQSELRTRLGYRGVTITEALKAGAFNACGTIRQHAVLAAQAGMDLILCSAQDVTERQAATTALAAALNGGQLPPGVGVLIAVDRSRSARGSPSGPGGYVTVVLAGAGKNDPTRRSSRCSNTS